MYSITCRFEFAYAHRILGHEGRCKWLHGHNGVAEITISSAELNELGMVVDFAKVKCMIGRWIDEFWDHNILLCKDDPLLEFPPATIALLCGRFPYIMKANPTAENMAKELFYASIEPFLRRYTIRVRIWETPKNMAEYGEEE